MASNARDFSSALARDNPVAIVGAGPVGLYLALALVQRGIACRVYERHAAPRQHSRSIGVHPVSLELLAALGLAEAFVAAGQPIRRGHAFRRFGDRLGTLDFACLPPPFPLVLAIPQDRTEALLEQALRERAPEVLQRGVALEGLVPRTESVRLLLRREPASSRRQGKAIGANPLDEVDTPLLVGCDGIRSTVREGAEIPFEGGPYPDTFVMGDYEDNTGLGPEAAIFLHAAGLIESFPLPGGRRRWVVRTGCEGDALPPANDDAAIERCIRCTVRERIGHELAGVACSMRSSFGVQHFLARRFVRGRVVLAGDAAHVVSPIGGQGMNLGWLDAARLVAALDQARGAEGKHDIAERRAKPCWPKSERSEQRETTLEAALARYERDARRIARRATLRSSFYTHLGRARRFPRLRDAAVRRLLATPALAKRAALFFTMRGLEPSRED